jgi:hypothetical protein
MDFHSATKNEILLFASKWMELENIILIEVSQAQKAKNCMFSLIQQTLHRRNPWSLSSFMKSKEEKSATGRDTGQTLKHF